MRRTFGWMLFTVGFIIAIAGGAVTKEVMGNYTVGITVGLLIVAIGWWMAHSKVD